MKKFIILNVCIVITAFAFVQGYISSESSVYAATGWENVTSTEELAEAFRYYCKSRDLTIDGSVADGVTKFTTQTFNNICNRLGLNVTAIQADLKKSTDGNLGVQYLFNSSGIATYNRIFAQFLQDNDLTVGDTADEQNNTVYSGYLFTDDNGNSCLVNVLTNNSMNVSNSSYVSDLGTNFIKPGGLDAYNFYKQATGVDYSTDSVNYLSFYKYSRLYNYELIGSNSTNSFSLGRGVYIYIIKNPYSVSNTGYPSITMTNSGTLYTSVTTFKKDGTFYRNVCLDAIQSNVQKDTIIFLNTNNNTINNNTYENNTYTTINNEGDTNNYTTDEEPAPGDTPSTNPSPITPPSDSGGSDGDVSFPNFNFKFPEINWSLGDLSSKFPFSIPFDLVAFYTVLNAEPRAPAIDANIPLGDFYDWHFQADFAQFDSYAVIIRNVEYISFVIILIFLTVKFVKG